MTLYDGVMLVDLVGLFLAISWAQRLGFLHAR